MNLLHSDPGALIGRLWARDPALWKQEPEHHRVIANRLGWLDVVAAMRLQSAEIEAFVREVIAHRFDHVLLLGMGGSSLCPEVLAAIFGSQSGFPSLSVLDSTDPDTIRSRRNSLDPAKTLFVVSSKSGTTIETDCFFRFFYEEVKTTGGDQAGSHFIAITDGGTVLEQEAKRRRFRRCFINPADIGGRYSALSYFGLVPAALVGIDLSRFLARAAQMQERCTALTPPDNPGFELGAFLADAYSVGRDKLTLQTSPSLGAFGVWVEQLVAESSGKEGKGIVPIEGESIRPSQDYGKDRVFVFVELEGEAGTTARQTKQELARDGHPVLTLRLGDRYDLAGEFFRWEFATAVACAGLGVNAFDEPNVKESKDNTSRLLGEFEKTGRVPQPPLKKTDAAVKGHLREAGAGDYIALLAWLEPSTRNRDLLEKIRRQIGRTCGVATTLGYGPRYLHSTGQLHKGGAANGVFLQLSASERNDLPIPDMPFSFGTLKLAQSCGDLQALEAHKRRVLRIDLGNDPEAGLQRLLDLL